MGILSAKASFTVPLSPEQVRERLGQKVKPGKLLAFEGDDSTQPFRGELAAGSFRIVRRRIARNSFEPVMTGTLAPGEPLGTAVSLTLEPHLAMMALVAFWAVVAAGCVLVFVNTVELTVPVVALLVLAPLFGPAVALVAFRLAVRPAVDSLKLLLSA